MERYCLLIALVLVMLTSGCAWPFGDVCNQEYRLLFAYELGGSSSKMCDQTPDGWDADAWPGYADYHDRQDDLEFNDLYEFVPVELEVWLLGDVDMGIAACMDRDPLWDVLDFAREQSWLTPEFDESDLWELGHDEWRPYWSSNCADFWQLEFDFRCFQLEHGLLPKSVQVLDEDYDRCDSREDLGIDWSGYYEGIDSDTSDEEESEEEE